MKPYAEQLYLLATGLSLPEKIEKAIANIQHYEAEALKWSDEGYFFANSYGKDSTVVRDLMAMSGVKFTANHSLTTLDPPELIRFGRKNHPETIEKHPEVPMLVRMAEKSNGPPTRLARWCCAEYKEMAGNDKVKVFGVRAAESKNRAGNWRTWTPHRTGSSWILNPILYWSDQDVWNYIHQNHLPYCSLYDEGFDRLGCIGCPMADKKRQAQWDRWPKYKIAWQRAFEKFWENRHGVPKDRGGPRWFDKKGLKNWQELWNWWMEEEQPEDDDECQMGLF